MATKKRKEILAEDQWNVEALYPDFRTWQTEFQKASPDRHSECWSKIREYRNTLQEGPDTLKAALDLILSADRKLTKLYTYAHLRHDEDIADDTHKAAYNQATSAIHHFIQETSWFEPEVLSIPDSAFQEYLTSPNLEDYRFHLEKLFRVKKHTLSPENEKLIALAGQALQTAQKTFSAITDADFKFGTVLDSKGEKKELTNSLYGLYMFDQDRTLRKNAFSTLHQHYKGYENTLCELLNGQVQCHIFNARARNYSSCLEAALYPKNIDTNVYHTLIETANQHLDALHDYAKLRKELLGVDSLHLYDMYVPLIADVDIKIPYDEAKELIVESVAPLGSDYQNLLKKGLSEDRWVDRYENLNKRSGAYSSGCYDSMPYILMNYKGLIRDAIVLAHEAGHSMHSLLSHQNQPYQYADYPIFVAEVASTFNEELLIKLLLSRCKSKEERAYLINQKIEDIRTTFFRQVMFAEFELFLHETAEKNIPLTPALLSEEYGKLLKKYFGEHVVIDPEGLSEWSRIPHFYYNFYVYQYATGISAALALCDKVSHGGDADRTAYLSFLKGGYSHYPIDLLKQAGVDMNTPEPVNACIARFKELVAKLKTEISN